MTCVRLGVGGDTISAELGPGNGEDACRAVWFIVALPTMLCCGCRRGKPADLGWPEIASLGMRGGGMDGGCVVGGGRIGEVLDAVSIFSCFAFWPERRLLLTPCEGRGGKGLAIGGGGSA